MRIDTTKRLSNKELKRPVKEYLSPCEFVFFYHLTVKELLEAIAAKPGAKKVDYFFVIDQDEVLQGIVTPKELLYNSPDARLIDIVEREVIKISEHDSLENALKILTHHHILFVPVVTGENQFLGVLEIVPHDDRQITQKTSVKEDIFQFIGFSIEQGKYKSSLTEFRYRMPWLALNLIGGLICAVIGQIYQVTLDEFVILALFIPLVLTLSESIGIQSMTLSLRFLHFRKIYWSQVMRRLMREWRAAILLAIGCGFVLTTFYFAWSREIHPIVAIGTSMGLSMVISATFGALFPITLHLLHLDPKVAAGPIVLMMADIFTITVYLSFSTWLLI
ncbi:MAG: magnesium transporter [Chlamydiia bacterium]|nr:magnesium transporter [Chlamydiia bacterium]